jgi:hypothetical protein
MTTAKSTQNVSRETFERISEAAEELRKALKALNPETGQLPSYSNPHPRGWTSSWDVARPWDDTTISNAVHYAFALILDEGWEDEMAEKQAELDEFNKEDEEG